MASARRAIRAAVVGMSATPTCGARDHATLLARALEAESVSCSWHWLARTEGSLLASGAEVRGWARALGSELASARPDVVLLHYSTFAYAHRGVPLYIHPTLAALRRSQIPVVTVMHEYAYPWRAWDWRANLWAATQRAVLVDVMRVSSAAVLTTDFRADSLRSKRWLPKRPVAIAPIFSNLPPPAPRARPQRPGQVIGLFGYAYQSAAVALVLDALRLLVDRGLDVQLRLLGAPGGASDAGRAWQQAAERRGLEDRLSFTGILPAQQLSDALADCEVLLFADSPGPTSRKGTLAGSLASGRPVVATDGPRTWHELTRAEAARVVAATPVALEQAVAALLADESLREALGARGKAFAEQQMGVGRSADVVAALFGEILAAAPSAP